MIEDEKRGKRRKTRPLQDESSSNDSSDSDSDSPPPTSRATNSRTRTPGTARTRGLAVPKSKNARARTPASGGDDDADEDLYDATPQRTRRTNASSTGPTQSQTSFASSLPASQIPSQSQTQEEDDDLADETAALSIGVTPARLTVFRATLGQLMNTDLFDDDAAEVDAIVRAINRKVGGAAGGSFSREETVAALTKMDDANNIMYVILPFLFYITGSAWKLTLNRYTGGEVVYKM